MKEWINWDEGIARLGGNEKIYKMLLGKFKAKTYMPELEAEIAAGDTDAAAKTAHTIKGVAANLSLAKVYSLSMDIETKLKNGEDTAEVLAELRTAVEKTLEAVDRAIS